MSFWPKVRIHSSAKPITPRAYGYRASRSMTRGGGGFRLARAHRRHPRPMVGVVGGFRRRAAVASAQTGLHPPRCHLLRHSGRRSEPRSTAGASSRGARRRRAALSLTLAVARYWFLHYVQDDKEEIGQNDRNASRRMTVLRGAQLRDHHFVIASISSDNSVNACWFSV